MPVSFSDFKLNKQLWKAISDAGYSEPTPIQEKTIPLILHGHDVLGIAQTGTGKTAAYLIPTIYKIKYAKGSDPRALIVVPTHELALQVNESIRLLAQYTDLRSVALVGGTGMKSQKDILAKGVDLVVATPGRLMDLYLGGFLNLKFVEIFIMDEAERLLDMGFRKQIDRILSVMKSKRQNLLFSATWNEKVKMISENFLVGPVEVSIEPDVKTVKTVSQAVYFVPNLKTKINLLEFLFAEKQYRKVIVFCKTKTTATNISKYIARKYGEDQVRLIHGNKDQNTRLNAMKMFSEEKIPFLVTTDIASRGIDVRDVSHVINFDIPLVYEDYIHRIGRTGRAMRTGDSVSFCSPADEYHLKKIQKLIGQKIPVEKLPVQVPVEETPYEERQEMLREIDHQRRKEDPDYQGAFHEKRRSKKKKK